MKLCKDLKGGGKEEMEEIMEKKAKREKGKRKKKEREFGLDNLEYLIHY